MLYQCHIVILHKKAECMIVLAIFTYTNSKYTCMGSKVGTTHAWYDLRVNRIHDHYDLEMEPVGYI